MSQHNLLNFMSNHTHTDRGSNLKMLDCINKVKPLINRAIELGYKGLAITDHSSISNHIKAIRYVKELKEQGIDFTLCLGSEEYVVDDCIDIKENYVGGGVTKFWHLIFIAKDKLGYEQLRMIDSMAWDNGFMTGKMRRTPIDKKQIENIIGDNKGHLLCSTACLGGELAHYYLDYLKTNNENSKNKCIEFVDWLINTFGKENIALEIQPSLQEEQIEYNKFLIKLGEYYSLPVIITNDAHYLKKEDKEVHKAFITSRDSIEREVGNFYDTTYLMSFDELWEYTEVFLTKEQFEKIINNSYNFTKDVEFIDMEHKTIIPERNLSNEVFEVKHIFKDWYNKCDGINNFANSDYIQDKFLLYMIEEGFIEKKQEFNDVNIKRIDWELNEIWKVSEALNDRMSAYYNLVDYIVDLCWEIGFVGISRGCFTKEALITTLNGMKTLDKVQIGDKVLSSNGKFNNVLNTMSYEIEEPLVEIKYCRQGSSYNKYPSICTLDHKILIKRENEIYYEQAKNLCNTDCVVYPKIKVNNEINKQIKIIDLQEYNIFNYEFDNNYIYEKVNNGNSYKYSSDWCSKNLSGSSSFYKNIGRLGNDYLNKKIRNENLIIEFFEKTPFTNLDNYKEFLNKHKYIIKKIPRYQKLDETFFCFVGLMFGDGWNLYSDKKAVFGLACNSSLNHTKNIFNRYVFNKVANRFNLNVYENKSNTKNLTQLTCSSKLVSYFLSQKLFLSIKGVDKIIPEWIYEQNISNLKWIKIGLEKTDGSINIKTNKYNFENTSLSIINLFKYVDNVLRNIPLALDVGESYIDKRNKNWICKESYKLRKCVIEKTNLIKEDDNYWFLPVQEINFIKKQNITVYDITVENDPSYTINNMCVHNSVTGYYTMYLIDMHQMNPITWNLPAYRHLNSSRVSFPDVDLDTSAKNRPKIVERLKKAFGKDNILNICSFRTETSKSACKTSCRGLGINSDEADYLASLVPVERGKQWSISDCFNGNEDKERKPLKEFISEVNRMSEYYKVDLRHTLEMIEGLVSGLTLHASGIYIFKDGYIKHNSKMKTPRGDEVTAWEMEDSDYSSGLKYDSLTTECQDKLEVCLLNYLTKYGKIEPQKTIRETYNKYLHPDVLDYTNKEMWDACSEGKIIDLFQFITSTGSSCIKKIKPHTLDEMANANSLMRITVKNGEQLIDKFIRYKQDISLWYQELKDYGISDENEIKALEEILLPSYGVPNVQEDIMELSMRKEISNFTLVDADLMRKIVAKKKDSEIEGLKNKFYEYVKKNENSINVANYVWEQCIEPQLAYSFSRNHVKPYSAEALQEMNLYHFFPNCYWNCSTLTVNAGLSDELEDEYKLVGDYYEDEDCSEQEKKKKGTKYGKIAKAIYRSKDYGVDVLPPDINKSEVIFTPNEEDETILFGIGGITKVNREISEQIISNRPYSNFEDFYNKHHYKGSKITKTIFIKLVQSGCFDKTDDRVEAMKWLTVYENPKKDCITMANLDNVISLGISLPKELTRAYKFKKYVLDKKYFYCNDAKFKSKKHYLVESEFALPFLEEHYMSLLTEEKDYYYTNEGLVIVDKSLEKILEPQFNQLKRLLNDEQTLKEYNKKMLENEYIKMIKVEDINKWSFDSISFYANGTHELDGINCEEYNISHFSDLPEEPFFINKTWGKRTWKHYDISRVCGVVLDRTDNRNMIDILTIDNEVISIKFNSGQYSYYKQTIEDDENYFKRGTMLMISGYRRGEDEFVAKKYKNSVFIHSVIKILKINEDKSLELQLERIGENDEL